MKNIILASKSPRRKELLRLLHLNFSVEVPEVNEVFPESIKVDKVSEYLAKLKADAFTNIPTDTVVITPSQTSIPSVPPPIVIPMIRDSISPKIIFKSKS